MNNRDNFSKSTKWNLGSAVNWVCVKCERPTRFLSMDGERQVKIGHAAHITAASPQGPRFDPDLTPAQRRAEENGAHLCPTCATIVDNDLEAFSPALLQQWQAGAAARLRQLAHQPVRVGTANTADVNRAVQAFLALCRRVRIHLTYDPAAIYVSQQDLASVRELFNACQWAQYTDGWRPGTEWVAGQTYHAQATRAVEMQNSALRSMALLYQAIATRGNGWLLDESGDYRPEAVFETDFWGRPTIEAQGKMASVAQLAHNRLSNFQNELSRLRGYVAESNTYTSI
jgi:hypothetical protein